MQIENMVILKEKDISLKAKGLYSLMTLLEPYGLTIEKIMEFSKESRGSISTVVNELERNGYIEIKKAERDRGKFAATAFTVMEEPMWKNRDGKTDVEKPQRKNQSGKVEMVDGATQEHKSSIPKQVSMEVIQPDPEEKPKQKKKKFIPPTVEEVDAYCVENSIYGVDAEAFVAYYESQDWKKANGRPVTSWKGCVVTWNRRSSNNKDTAQQKSSTTMFGIDWANV